MKIWQYVKILCELRPAAQRLHALVEKRVDILVQPLSLRVQGRKGRVVAHDVVEQQSASRLAALDKTTSATKIRHAHSP